MITPVLVEKAERESCRNTSATIAIRAGDLNTLSGHLLCPLGEVDGWRAFALCTLRACP